jgi:hypothetical protein
MIKIKLSIVNEEGDEVRLIVRLDDEADLPTVVRSAEHLAARAFSAAERVGL